MIAVAARRGLLEMSCDVCRTDPAKRLAWGCDAPTKAPLFEIECIRCTGRSRSHCQLCRGTGRLEIFRCPWATTPGWVVEFFELYNLIEVALPAAGGLQDQPALFLRALDVVNREQNKYEKRKKLLAKGAPQSGYRKGRGSRKGRARR